MFSTRAREQYAQWAMTDRRTLKRVTPPRKEKSYPFCRYSYMATAEVLVLIAPARTELRTRRSTLGRRRSLGSEPDHALQSL
jgi:hypothetical protein